MKVCFTADYTVKAVDGETFKKGKTYDMSPASGRHFINKAIAVEVPSAGSTEPETASVAPSEEAVRPRGRPRTATAH